jgi:hypothetical protein
VSQASRSSNIRLCHPCNLAFITVHHTCPWPQNFNVENKLGIHAVSAFIPLQYLATLAHICADLGYCWDCFHVGIFEPPCEPGEFQWGIFLPRSRLSEALSSRYWYGKWEDSDEGPATGLYSDEIPVSADGWTVSDLKVCMCLSECKTRQ